MPQNILYINANGPLAQTAWDVQLVTDLVAAGNTVNVVAHTVVTGLGLGGDMQSRQTVIIGPGNSATTASNVSGSVLAGRIGTDLINFQGLIVTFSASRSIIPRLGIVSTTTYGISGTFLETQNTGTVLDLINSPYSTASNDAPVGVSGFEHLLTSTIAATRTLGTTSAPAIGGLGDIAALRSDASAVSIVVYPRDAARATPDVGTMAGARAFLVGGVNWQNRQVNMRDILLSIITQFEGTAPTLPTVVAGGFRTIKVAESVIISSTESGGTSAAWTSSLGGTFANAALASTTWTAPPSITGNAQTATLTRTVSNSAGTSTATTTVRVRASAGAPSLPSVVIPLSGSVLGGGTALAALNDASEATGVLVSTINDAGLIRLPDLTSFTLEELVMSFRLSAGTTARVQAQAVNWGASTTEADVRAGGGTAVGSYQIFDATSTLTDFRYFMAPSTRIAIANPSRVGILWTVTEAS